MNLHFLTPPLVQLALHHYDNIESMQATWVQRGDWFFSTFGPGNLWLVADRPLERFTDYEMLLRLLEQRNRAKYELLHKGTPFFFLSWLAFDLRNYEKCLYYLDASISEDVKNAPTNWLALPGAHYLRLTTDQTHPANRVIAAIRLNLDRELLRFNAISGLNSITLDAVIDRFVAPFIQQGTTRTIVSALYVYLLENEERLLELQLKSTQGSSLGPVIATLFSGALIFESILKALYPNNDNGQPNKTLASIFNNTSAFQQDFATGVQTSAASLQDIMNWIGNESLLTALSAAARIRNTTGHNLVWDNVFQTPTHYKTLANQLTNALLYVIERKFIR
jgi:hypothetical protein